MKQAQAEPNWTPIRPMIYPPLKSVLPEALDWHSLPALPPGARFAVVAGRPAERGMYVIRIRVPHGVKLLPHRHPENRIYTVISGVLHAGVGERFNSEAAVAYPPGSTVLLPSDTPHFQWARSGEYVAQVMGIGPFGLDYIDWLDDPRSFR